MRAITAYLHANDGMGTGLQLDLTGKLATLGTISWSLDEELTRIKPGTLSLKVWDEGGSIWTWLQAHLASSDGTGRAQLFPPFIELQVEAERRFLGVVSVDQIRRDLKSQVVELQAQDWSVLLRDKVLEGSAWQRRLPGVISTRTGQTYSGFEGARGVWVTAPFDHVQVGDILTTSLSGSTQYRVDSIGSEGSTVALYITLKGWDHPLARLSDFLFYGSGGVPLTFTRVSQSLEVEQPWYSVANTLTPTQEAPIYVVQLDYVDWLVAGDELRSVSGTLYKIADVDTERREIHLAEPLSGNLLAADRLYFSEACRNQLVFEDAGLLIQRAAAPAVVDLARFEPALLPRPVLAWLPWKNPSTVATDTDPRNISDLEATLTGIQLISQAQGKTWTGNPESGYTVASLFGRHVDWTSQLTAAPSVLMPDGSVALAPTAEPRNRSRAEWKHVNPELLDGDWQPLYPPLFTPSAHLWPGAVVGHDYSQLRRLVVDNTADTITEQRWDGSAWSAGTSSAWPVIGWKPCALAPMIGVPGTTGPVSPQGLAVLALATNGTSYELQLIWAGAPLRLSVSADRATGALLRTTPWASYLFGPGGFGRVRIGGGALVLDWVAVYDAATCILWPETLAALDADTLFIFGRYATKQEDGSTRTETWAFQLNPAPDTTAPELGVGWREMVMPGAPTIAVARRDPASSGTSGRIMGVLGGRLFQISRRLPRTIERVDASAMSSGELIEYIAQAQNALVAPLPDGSLEIISRNTPAGTLDLTVDRVAVTQMRASANFFSVVRVTGAEDAIYADFPGQWDAATSTAAGGKALEINSHPLVWTFSHAYAIAAAYGGFLGQPRAAEEQTWFHDDASTAPPWEALRRWERFTINGASSQWLLLGLTEDLIKGEGKATLLEAP